MIVLYLFRFPKLVPDLKRPMAVARLTGACFHAGGLIYFDAFFSGGVIGGEVACDCGVILKILWLGFDYFGV